MALSTKARERSENPKNNFEHTGHSSLLSAPPSEGSPTCPRGPSPRSKESSRRRRTVVASRGDLYYTFEWPSEPDSLSASWGEVARELDDDRASRSVARRAPPSERKGRSAQQPTTDLDALVDAARKRPRRSPPRRSAFEVRAWHAAAPTRRGARRDENQKNRRVARVCASSLCRIAHAFGAFFSTRFGKV